MAGRFEGVSDLEWRLLEDVFPPAPPKRGRGMPHAPLWTAMSVKECDASLAATLAGGWHAGHHASADAGRGRGKRDDSLGVWRRGRRFFPLERVAARASPGEGKAKGSSSTASLTGAGCPWRTALRRPMGMSAPK
jgi:hypothetical protein